MSEERLNHYKEWIEDNEEIVVDSSIFEELVKEIKRLNNIINKTIESVQEHYDNSYSTDDVNDIGCGTYDDLMKILKGIDEQ